jgi:hypothetical protein
MNRLGGSQQSLKNNKGRLGQENKRQGDWICVLCNNLNYSFRDNCNRCKNLTREENMKLYSKKDYIDTGYDLREPLGEIFFQRLHSLQEQPTSKHYFDDQIPTLKDSRRSEGQIKVETSFPVAERFLKPEKGGFPSLLYLTPTRYGKDNCE